MLVKLYVFSVKMASLFIALFLAGCNLTDDALQGGFASGSQVDLSLASISSQKFNVLNNGDATSDNSPVIQGVVGSSFDGATVHISTSSSCATSVGTATIEGGRFEVANSSLSVEKSAVSESVNFYAWLSSGDQQSRCIDLGLSLSLWAPNQVIWEPYRVTISPDGNALYVVDRTNKSLFRVNPVNGGRTLLSGSDRGAGVAFIRIQDADVSRDGNSLFVVDSDLLALLKVDLVTGDRVVVSDASTGSGPVFGFPTSLVVSQSEDTVYVADMVNDAVYSVDLQTGNRTPVSDNVGTGTGTSFSVVYGIDINGDETKLYVVDAVLDALMEVDIATGNRVIISDSGTGTGGHLENSYGLALNSAKTKAYVTNQSAGAGSLVEIDLASGNRSVVSDASTGIGRDLTEPSSVALSPDGLKAYVVEDSWMSDSVYAIDLATGDRSGLSTSSTGDGPRSTYPEQITFTADEQKIYVADSVQDALFLVDIATGDRIRVSSASDGSGTNFSNPHGVAVTADGSTVYVLDHDADAIFSVDPVTGNRTIFSNASNGTGTGFSRPEKMILSHDESTLYVTDWTLDAVFAVSTATGNRTILSNSSNGSGPVLNLPLGITQDAAGSFAYVNDVIGASGSGNYGVVRVELGTGNRVVISSDSLGTGPELRNTSNIALSPSGATAYVADKLSRAVFSVDIATGNRSIIASAAVGEGPMISPHSILVPSSDTQRIYFSDSSLGAIIELDLATGKRKIISR